MCISSFHIHVEPRLFQTLLVAKLEITIQEQEEKLLHERTQTLLGLISEKVFKKNADTLEMPCSWLFRLNANMFFDTCTFYGISFPIPLPLVYILTLFVYIYFMHPYNPHNRMPA